MDPVTHAILGASAAIARTKRSDAIRAALVCGVLSGTFPDLDVLIKKDADPMFGLGFHRHFTHSLLFVPFGAALLAFAIKHLLRFRQSWRELFVYCLFGMACHGMLDAMTNYGTHLFWPFTNRRESWSIISIVDPIFTFTLLALLVLACLRANRRFAMAGLCFALCYWSFGYYQREQATLAMQHEAHERGHTIERAEVKPGFANLFVWRGQYLHQGKIHIDAYHISPWKGSLIYPGGSLPAFAGEAPSSLQARDLVYFNFFSDGWLAYAPQNPGLIADMRFSSLPNQFDPIWGIRFRDDAPDAHVNFEMKRVRTQGDWLVLWDMIRGEAP